MNIQSKQKISALTPIHAFVVYKGEGQYEADDLLHTAVHNIKKVRGQPVLMPGRLLTDSDLTHLIQGSKSSDAMTRWVDESILASGPDRMVWFTPPCQRSMFFETTKGIKPSIQGQAQLALPGLVWMTWGNALYVYATQCDGRPDQQTQLFQAPLFNVWSRGKVCFGSAKLPNAENRKSPAAWEQMMFGSRFTHPNFTQKDRLMLGDPVSYWAAQLKQASDKFPIDKLVQIPLKVGDLIREDLEVVIDGIGKATGEF